MHQISIIIPNYNGASLLTKNIPFVIKSAEFYRKKNGQKIEIIIIDDASTDESLAVLYYLHKQYNKKVPILIFQNEKNLGFSGTVNKGVRKSTGEFLILLNTDVRPSEGFIQPLISHFQDEKLFAVGCLDKSIEGEKIVLRGRGIGRWRRGLFIHQAGKLDKDSTLWVSGGSGMFRKDIWERLSGFNTLFNPFYWEDIDLSYRAQKAGYTVRFEKDSVVTHKHEEGSIKESASKEKINTIAFRNQFIFTWVNLTDADLLISHFFFLPFHVAKAFLRLDRQFIFGFLRAVLQLPEIIKKRKQVKKYAIHLDKTIQLLS